MTVDPDREANLRLRGRVIQLQAQVRTAFLLQIAIMQYRSQVDPRSLPENLMAVRVNLDAEVAATLRSLAAEIEPTEPRPRGSGSGFSMDSVETAFQQCEYALRKWQELSPEKTLSPLAEGVLHLSRQLAEILRGTAVA